jgi:hypothetical protein
LFERKSISSRRWREVNIGEGTEGIGHLSLEEETIVAEVVRAGSSLKTQLIVGLGRTLKFATSTVANSPPLVGAEVGITHLITGGEPRR